MNVAAHTSSFMPQAPPNAGAKVQSAPTRGDHTSVRASDRSPFAARLSAMQAKQAEADPARQAANKLIASAFIIPALQSLRENALAAENGPFAPNLVEKRFGPILDQHIADEIVNASNFDLTDTIVDRVSRTSTHAQHDLHDVFHSQAEPADTMLNVKG